MSHVPRPRGVPAAQSKGVPRECQDRSGPERSGVEHGSAQTAELDRLHHHRVTPLEPESSVCKSFWNYLQLSSKGKKPKTHVDRVSNHRISDIEKSHPIPLNNSQRRHISLFLLCVACDLVRCFPAHLDRIGLPFSDSVDFNRYCDSVFLLRL